MAYNIQLGDAQLQKLVLHKVGNKAENEGVLAAKQTFDLQDQSLKEILLGYFLDSFTAEACYQFNHETDLNLNEIYTYCKTIFENLETFHEQSVNILQHLYNNSEHNKIKAGELYITYFENCVFEDELLPAIGIFKAENKDTFLKIKLNENDEFVLEYEQGTNTAKLDKGCLIFDTHNEEGYRILSVDVKSADAKYWKDHFLRLTQLQDDDFKTKNYLQMCKSFSKSLLKEEGAEKQEQISFLNKSLEFFEENDAFSTEEFTEKVFEGDEEQSLKFQSFKEDYEQKNGIQYQLNPEEEEEEFFIAPEVVKKAKKALRSIIQLDTQLEIKLTSPQAEGFIEKAYDEEREMYYYKIYFNQEK